MNRKIIRGWVLRICIYLLIGLAFAVFLYVLNNYIIGIRKGITQTELYQLETIVLMALSTCLILHRLGKPGNRDSSNSASGKRRPADAIAPAGLPRAEP